MRILLLSAILVGAPAAAQGSANAPGMAPATKPMTATQHANEGYKHQNLARQPGQDRAAHWARAAEHYRKAAELARAETAKRPAR